MKGDEGLVDLLLAKVIPSQYCIYLRAVKSTTRVTFHQFKVCLSFPSLLFMVSTTDALRALIDIALTSYFSLP